MLPDVFLTAEWRYLALLNYRVDPKLLTDYVPAGTELDDWQGHAYVSLVGFHFRNARIFGIPVPLHQAFEEVNLRLYIRRRVGDELRRGVRFIKEIVPAAAVTTMARLTYNEPYETREMRHRIESPHGPSPIMAEYSWSQKHGWSRLMVTGAGTAEFPLPGSEEEFITDRPWGYGTQRDGRTIEYRVEHPKWRVWQAESHLLESDPTELYGTALGKVLERPPTSVFLADGSAIKVHLPNRVATLIRRP
ncbi:MAG TPA: DUF2071 domain-containing protein [Rhodothermia bacterium]|nr:DUF2071 domain-containing protein [Rhodothermia bacterium]